MNILLWVLQIALGFLCLSGGPYKITHFEQLQQMNASMRALPKGLWMFLGGFEALAGLALILPGAIKIKPALTPIAGVALAVESLLISCIYLYYSDFAPVAFTGPMVVMAAFIAYGRFVLKPF